VRLLLDEHISARLAVQLRARGHDVIALTEVDEMRGQPDTAVFEWALDQERSIVTYDTGFVSLLKERVALQLPAPDLIVVPSRRFPGGDRGHGALLEALAVLLGAHLPDAVGGRLTWLDERPDSA
jgi:uncharacterized protein DUF5615